MTSPRNSLRSSPPRGPRRPRGGPSGGGMQKGFSLLEVLAAFVILALVATALFRLFGGALGNAGVAEDASRAVLVAQSRLDAARGELRGGSTSGTEQDRYEWTTRIEPWEAPDAAAAQPSGVAPLLTPTQLF